MRKIYAVFIGVSVVTLSLLSSCKDKKAAEDKSTNPITVQKEKPKAVQPEKEKIYPLTTAPKKPVIKKIIVKEGEWLYNISRREYGNTSGWQKIYDANKAVINNPDLIYPNQELIIPD